ncbi:RNA-directed DNA polymerase, eukaryota [Tanacetum coccineum]
MPRDDPIIERIPRRSLKKRNITPSKNELPHIGSNVAFEENMISRFNIGIARRTRDGRNIHTTRREIQSMRESVQGKPPHKHIDLSGDRFIPSSSMSKSGKNILVNPITSILNVRQIMRKISSWWNIDYSDVNSYEEWRVWLVSIRIQSNLKGVLEGCILCSNSSFRRIPRGGIEQNQFDSLVELVRSVTIVPSADRWNWNLESTGIFSVASARRRIDEICLPNIGEETRWVKCVPIKINVLAWKIKTDALPTRFNISRRGIDIQDMSCPICDNAIESTDHLFFRCGLVRDIANKVLSWWNLDHANLNSYAE